MITTVWTPTADSEIAEADLLEQRTPAAETDLDVDTRAMQGAEQTALVAAETTPRWDVPEHDQLDQLWSLPDDDAEDEYERTPQY